MTWSGIIAAFIPTLHFVQSGIGESNPSSQLGKLSLSRLTNPAFQIQSKLYQKNVKIHMLSRGGEMVYARALRALECITHAGPSPALGTTECGSDGRAPRLGRGGPRFESGHSDLFICSSLKKFYKNRMRLESTANILRMILCSNKEFKSWNFNCFDQFSIG